MDGASSVAALIGLTGLAAETTVKTIKIIKALGNLPKDLKSLSNWLGRLNALLQAIQNIPPQAPLEDSQLRLLSIHVQAVFKLVTQLSTKLTDQTSRLDTSNRAKRQVKKLKVFLSADETEKQVRDIRQAVESLNLCHSEISRAYTDGIRQVLFKTSEEVTSANAKADRLINLGTETNDKLEEISAKLEDFDLRSTQDEFFERISSTIHSRSSLLEKHVRKLDKNITRTAYNHSLITESLKESLVAEVKCAIVPELKSCIANLATQAARKERTCLTKNFDTGWDKWDDTISPQSTRISPEYELDPDASRSNQELLDLKTMTVNGALGRRFAPFQDDKRAYSKNDITRYEHETIVEYRASFSWLGNLEISVQRRTIANDYLVQQWICLNISITPTTRLLRRGARIGLSWDKGKAQLDSLTNMRLYLPRILSKQDPLILFLIKEATSNFIHQFRTGRYSVRDEVLFSDGRTYSLAAIAFMSRWACYDACEFLLHHGATVPSAMWRLFIDRALATNADQALRCTRSTITNGTDIDSIPRLSSLHFEMVLSAISALPESVPDQVLLSKTIWDTDLHLEIWAETCRINNLKNLQDLERDNSLWQSLMKRKQSDIRLEDDLGDTCFNGLILRYRGCFMEIESRIQNGGSGDGDDDCYHDIERNAKLTDAFMKSSLNKALFESRAKGLLSMHADPCQIDSRGLTPTIQAFISFVESFDFGSYLGSLWINALTTSNVDVVATARHSFRLCLDGHGVLGSVNEFLMEWDSHPAICFDSLEEFQDFLLDSFEDCGIYSDESWWVQAEENEWDTSATAVDFTPPTKYDTGKQDLQVRKRRINVLEDE